MPKQTFILNGERVQVDVEDDVRLLWVLRDVLKVHGHKYGCGLRVCRACTSHINGKEFPCAVPVGDLKPEDRITTIEGLAGTVGKGLHPMDSGATVYRANRGCSAIRTVTSSACPSRKSCTATLSPGRTARSSPSRASKVSTP